MGMRPHSRQILSVEEAFGANGWHGELVEGREVLRAGFEAHHTRVDLTAQAFPPLNALSVVGESPMAVEETHLRYLLELLARANKKLTLGGFEYDMDRELLVFRQTNVFERERYDADIIASMIHCAVAETDRMIPFAATVRDLPAELLSDLDLELLLEREDLVPGAAYTGMEEEEY